MTKSEQLVIGQFYTRAQACALVGGGQLQGFITSRDGAPLALFAKEASNPGMRQGVYTISCMNSQRSGALLARWLRSGAPLPVFWWQGPNRWEYAGRWRPRTQLTRGPLFAAEVARCRDRDHARAVTMVLVTEALAQG
jgi:hypothetical protein